MAKLAVFLFTVCLFAEESAHHFQAEPGFGVRYEKSRYFLEPTAEWVDHKLRPSVEGGVVWKKVDFFAGVFQFRTGAKIPIRGEIKAVALLERQQGVLGGLSLPLKERAEFIVVANQKVVKTIFLVRFK
jgi:hypothetical protein